MSITENLINHSQLAESNFQLTHKVHIDSESFSSKPESTNKISKRITQAFDNLTAQAIAARLTNGQTIIPAYIQGTRKNDNWVSQSLFLIDIDHDLTPDQALARLQEYGLTCTFIYPTFSDTDEHPKFRIAFQLNRVIFDKTYRDHIQNALLLLFPEADQSCKDASRLFYGTNKGLIYERYDACLDLQVLFDVATFYACKDSSGGNYKRDLERVCKRLGFSENGRFYATPYNIYIDNPVNPSKSEKTTLHNSRSLEIIEGVNLYELSKDVLILGDLMNPQVKLLHPQLVGLATNLRWIKGGEKVFNDCLKSNPNYNYGEKSKIMHYCKLKDYYPQRLENFSPYPEDHQYTNLLEAAKKKSIIRLTPHDTKPMPTARLELNQILTDILASNDTDIHIIKAATGLGKTEAILNLDNVLIALPNHNLKQEVSTRMQVDHLVTPDYHLLPDNVKMYLDYLYSIGAWNRVNDYLIEQSQSQPEVQNYRNQLLTAYAANGTVLTTHQKALRIDFSHNTVIFDEDPLAAQLAIAKVTINDLVSLSDNLNNHQDRNTLKTTICKLIDQPTNTVFPVNTVIFEDQDALVNEVSDNPNRYSSNVLEFFNADYYCKSAKDGTIEYIRSFYLPINKKIIILSATANEKLYRLMYEDRVKFYDLSQVEMVGMILQYTDRSCSRSSLNNNLDRIVNTVFKQGNQNNPTITFASYKDCLRAKGINVYLDNHFGKTVGTNVLESQDINVIGTPHVSSNTIALYAHALNLKIKSSDLAMYNQQVRHNGFRFWFNTYNDPDLRTIQFYFIESELRQAIGRARPNTTNATVHLYSNYPLPEARVTEDEKQLGRARLVKDCFQLSKDRLQLNQNTEVPTVDQGLLQLS